MIDLIEGDWYLKGTCSCMGGGTKKYKNDKYPGVEIRISRQNKFQIRQTGQTKIQGNQSTFKFRYEHFIQTIPALD